MPQRTGEPLAPAPAAGAGRSPGGPGTGSPREAGGPAAFPPERIDAGAVVLRRVRIEDAARIAWAVAASLDHLRPWMPWAVPEAASLQAQLARVAEANELWEAGADYIYSVLPRGQDTAAAQDTVAGQAGLHRRPADGGIEIGYWIAVSHTRQGLGTAAAQALTPVALRLPGVKRVEIHCDEANTASCAIPRKLGYRLDRIDAHEPEAPGEQGRRMIWVMDGAGGAGAQTPPPAAPETTQTGTREAR